MREMPIVVITVGFPEFFWVVALRHFITKKKTPKHGYSSYPAATCFMQNVWSK